MRRIVIGASVLVLATSTLVAAPKKKKTPQSKKDKTKDKDKDKDKGSADTTEIEMDGGGDGSGGTGGGGGGGTGIGSDTPDLAKPPEPTPAPTTPMPGARSLDMNERPLTLPKGQTEIHGGFPIGVVTSAPDLMGNKTSTTLFGFGVGLTYGLDDKTELGGDYAVSLSPGDIKGPLTLHGAYTLAKAAKYDLAIGGAFVVHPVSAGTTTTYVALQLGAWFRYRATPKVSIFTGLPSTPHPDVSLARTGFAFPPMPYQLSLGLNSGGAISLNLPVGVAIQAAPKVYVFAATNIANIKLANTQHAFLFADFIPITLGGFYSINKLDIGAEFSDDLKQAGDYLTFSILARYFIK